MKVIDLGVCAVRSMAFSILLLASGIPDARAARTEAEADLAATEAVPDARGEARLKAAGRREDQPRYIELNLHGLPSDVYTVTVHEADGTTTTLGRFRAGSVREDITPGMIQHLNRWRGRFNLDETTEVLQPASIVISSEAGLHVLKGVFAEKGSPRTRTGGGGGGGGGNSGGGRLFFVAPVNPGTAPEASGFAELKGREGRNGASGTFRLEASGLPAFTFIIINIDGTDMTAAQTDGNGVLRVRMTSRDFDVFSTSTVSIRDEFGEELASAQF